MEHESKLLATMSHPNIVGFRAFQRLSDNKLCLALEMCECSLYTLIQERCFCALGEGMAEAYCLSTSDSGQTPEARPLLRADEVMHCGLAIARGLAYMHVEHKLLHGDVKSSNVLVSRDLKTVKICDLGVSLRLQDDLSGLLHPESDVYEGTEPWRPPETLSSSGEGVVGGSSPESVQAGMCLCDRTDIFSFGLVLWEMLVGDVPHASKIPRGSSAYRKSLGTRPALPLLPSEYQLLEQVFRDCTMRVPTTRPSATELVHFLSSDSSPNSNQ